MRPSQWWFWWESWSNYNSVKTRLFISTSNERKNVQPTVSWWGAFWGIVKCNGVAWLSTTKNAYCGASEFLYRRKLMKIWRCLTNFVESRRQRNDVDEDEHMAMLAQTDFHRIGIHSSIKSHLMIICSKPCSFKNPRLCSLCRELDHLVAIWYEKDNAVCNICKAKDHIAGACKRKLKRSNMKGSNSFRIFVIILCHADWHKSTWNLVFRDLANTTDEASHVSDCALRKYSKNWFEKKQS